MTKLLNLKQTQVKTVENVCRLDLSEGHIQFLKGLTSQNVSWSMQCERILKQTEKCSPSESHLDLIAEFTLEFLT